MATIAGISIMVGPFDHFEDLLEMAGDRFQLVFPVTFTTEA
jgi:hypothetical protein